MVSTREDKRKITMTIDDEIFFSFKKLCKENSLKVGAKVESMMKDFSQKEKGDEND